MSVLQYDIAIIGGGCSGLMTATAIVKNNPKLKVVIIEKNSRVGRKLLATGNGRCNLSNTRISPEFYFGTCQPYVATILKDCDFVRNYFSDVGLLTVSDNEGRIYPLSNHVNAVLDCMRNYYQTFGKVDELCNTVVKSVQRRKRYLLDCVGEDSEKIRIVAENVVLSCGGKASPKLSTDGMGYDILNNLHITTSVLFPSLVPVICKDTLLNMLKGIRVKGSASLYINNNMISTQYGEIQFNEKTISGICIFQLSRYVNEFFVSGKKGSIRIALDLLPDYSQSQCSQLLFQRVQQFGKYELAIFFDGFLHQKVASALFRKCGIRDLHRKSATLTKKEIFLLSHTLKQWEFIPEQTGSFENAQITAGGIVPAEIDFLRMESVKYRHLYFCGEVVDVDGLCGGYNLHWAWCSGIAVAYAITGKIYND